MHSDVKKNLQFLWRSFRNTVLKRRKRKINNFGRLSLQARDTVFVFTIFSAVRHLGETAWDGETQISGDYILVCVRACVHPCTYREQNEITEVPKYLSSQLKIFSFRRIIKKKIGGWVDGVWAL